jgi:ABC-2 type transport system permease protein
VSAFSWIVRKDLAVFFADRKGAAMVIVVPTVLGILMGTIFDGDDGPNPLEIGVVDDDHGAEVADLVRRLDAEASLVVVPMTEAEAREKVEGGDLGVAVHFAAGCSTKLTPQAMFLPGDRGGLTLWVDPSRQTEADIVTGLLTKTMMESVFSKVGDPAEQRRMFTELRAGLGAEAEARPELAKFLEDGGAFAEENDARQKAEPGKGGGMALEPPLSVKAEPLVAAGPTAGFNSYAHTFAGMLMQFLLFSASAHAKGLFAERSNGTLDRLRMTTASRTSILLGSATALGVVSLVATALVFGVGALFFDIEMRSGALAFSLVALGQAALVGSFALLLAGLAHSEKQLDAIGTLVILTLCFVSGAWVPSFMLPSFLHAVGPLVPTRWLLDGMAGATWRGPGLGHALTAAGALLAFSAVFSFIGVRRFRWG